MADTNNDTGSTRKKVGDALMLVGALLFLTAVVADARTVVVVIPILVLMGGALVTLTATPASQDRR